MATEPEITTGMTARDWFQEGYADGVSGTAYESGPLDQPAVAIEQWRSGWHAGALEHVVLGEGA